MSNINLLLINLVNFDKNEILTNKKGRQNSNVVSQLLKLALSKIQLNTENKSSYKWTRNGEILGHTVYIRIREYPVKNFVLISIKSGTHINSINPKVYCAVLEMRGRNFFI